MKQSTTTTQIQNRTNEICRKSQQARQLKCYYEHSLHFPFSQNNARTRTPCMHTKIHQKKGYLSVMPSSFCSFFLLTISNGYRKTMLLLAQEGIAKHTQKKQKTNMILWKAARKKMCFFFLFLFIYFCFCFWEMSMVKLLRIRRHTNEVEKGIKMENIAYIQLAVFSTICHWNIWDAMTTSNTKRNQQNKNSKNCAHILLCVRQTT